MNKKYIALSGSLRKGSFNTAVLKSAQEVAPEGTTLEIADISNFPLFNQDLEAEFPSVVQQLKDKIKESDGVIFATPEYNRSVSGVLKNAIDWSSRPYGDNAFAGKPALVLGASVGHIGTAVAQSHLKEILLYLDMKVVGQPEFYLGLASDKVDGEGNISDQDTKNHIIKALEKLASF